MNEIRSSFTYKLFLSLVLTIKYNLNFNSGTGVIFNHNRNHGYEIIIINKEGDSDCIELCNATVDLFRPYNLQDYIHIEPSAINMPNSSMLNIMNELDVEGIVIEKLDNYVYIQVSPEEHIKF